ncbi:MAG: hypothetical protein AUJ92_13690 [Armatimonadetes bacterium CG2_30_59_28]|nr:dihydroorotate dehydrogenase electron transfer subunit [Armatimonadota bacterium]OIO92701.1 MAG: hypothetical protein AUJ92_13690 [Armatimonadetes bacterium CG2_30_59_28]PIU65104.1 MAG: dihydroorotate dehydrogenase electron transfer subunit [Armatimonadetes bacterium CG07_land_8_20_14_0_80_59_28]PJB77073.1 MAG: dihydroorotate dehydrogenase electron transfer subunit [Armatimonadetes bacterium CG_4_9_14_3_um_filter_58_7]
MYSCSVLSNKLISPGYWQMQMRMPDDFRAPLPGQFVQVACGSGTDPLLRRPFSACTFSQADRALSIVYQVVGRGTQFLTTVAVGESISIVGPLGNGFPLNETARPILLSGGVGVPPIVFLASWLLSEKRVPPWHITVLQGARGRRGILCRDLLHGMGLQLQVATDDGSEGYHGTVVDLLKAVTKQSGGSEGATIYACGPYAMLSAVASYAESSQVKAYVSMEAAMSCGFGVCMGCVLPTKQGYLRCCHAGPVFDAEDIRWT